MIQKFEKIFIHRSQKFLSNSESQGILKNKDLSNADKVLLLYALSHAETFNPSPSFLAEHLGWSESSVNRSLSRLRKHRYYSTHGHRSEKGIFSNCHHHFFSTPYEGNNHLSKMTNGCQPSVKNDKWTKDAVSSDIKPNGEKAPSVKNDKWTKEQSLTDTQVNTADQPFSKNDSLIESKNRKQNRKQQQTVVAENSFQDEICSLSALFGVHESFVSKCMKNYGKTLDELRSVMFYARGKNPNNYEGYVTQCLKNGFDPDKVLTSKSAKQDDYRYTGARGLTPEEKEADRRAHEEALRIVEEERSAAAQPAAAQPAQQEEYAQPVRHAPVDVERIKHLNPFRESPAIPKVRVPSKEIEARRQKLREQAGIISGDC